MTILLYKTEPDELCRAGYECDICKTRSPIARLLEGVGGVYNMKAENAEEGVRDFIANKLPIVLKDWVVVKYEDTDVFLCPRCRLS